jgi:hypothetical protein
MDQFQRTDDDVTAGAIKAIKKYNNSRGGKYFGGVVNTDAFPLGNKNKGFDRLNPAIDSIIPGNIVAGGGKLRDYCRRTTHSTQAAEACGIRHGNEDTRPPLDPKCVIL